MYILLDLINRKPYFIVLITILVVLAGIWINTYFYNGYLVKKLKQDHLKYHGIIPPVMNKILIGLGVIIMVICFIVYPMFTKVLLPTSLWHDNQNPNHVIGFNSIIEKGETLRSFYTGAITEEGLTNLKDEKYEDHSRYLQVKDKRYYLLAWGEQLMMISNHETKTYTKISSTLDSLGFDHEPTEEELNEYAKIAEENTRRQNLARCIDLGDGIKGWVNINVRPMPDIYITQHIEDQFLVDFNIFVPLEENGITDIELWGGIFEPDNLWFYAQIMLGAPYERGSNSILEHEFYSDQWQYNINEYSIEDITNSLRMQNIRLKGIRNGEEFDINIPLKDFVTSEFE